MRRVYCEFPGPIRAAIIWGLPLFVLGALALFWGGSSGMSRVLGAEGSGVRLSGVMGESVPEIVPCTTNMQGQKKPLRPDFGASKSSYTFFPGNVPNVTPAKHTRPTCYKWLRVSAWPLGVCRPP